MTLGKPRAKSGQGGVGQHLCFPAGLSCGFHLPASSHFAPRTQQSQSTSSMLSSLPVRGKALHSRGRSPTSPAPACLLRSDRLHLPQLSPLCTNECTYAHVCVNMPTRLYGDTCGQAPVTVSTAEAQVHACIHEYVYTHACHVYACHGYGTHVHVNCVRVCM